MFGLTYVLLTCLELTRTEPARYMSGLIILIAFCLKTVGEMRGSIIWDVHGLKVKEKGVV